MKSVTVVREIFRIDDTDIKFVSLQHPVVGCGARFAPVVFTCSDDDMSVKWMALC